MAFSLDSATVAWLVVPGTIQPVRPDQRWRCAGCNAPIRPEEAWLVKYRLDGQPDRARRDLICVDCATRLAAVASRTADETS